MSGTVEYVSILCRLIIRTRAAVQISVGEKGAVRAWIPRTLIHGADEIGLEARSIGIRFNLRIMRWKAAELGLLPSPATGAATLFPPADNSSEQRAERANLPDAPPAAERARMAIAFAESRDYNGGKECQAVLNNIRAGRTIFTAPDRLTLTKLGFDTLEAAKKAS